MVVTTTLSNQDLGLPLPKSTTDCILIVDQNGIIYFSNSNIKSIFEYEETDLFKKEVALLFPAKFSKKINTYINRYYYGLEIKLNDASNNLFGRKKSGLIFPIECTFQHYEYFNKNMIMLRIVKKENFKNNKLSEKEEYLEQCLINEKRINKQHSQFVSKASHELRTPLTSILNATTILEKIKGSNKNEAIHARNINRIKTSINHFTNVLNDFLTINRIEEKNNLNLFDTNISNFTKKILDNIQDPNNKTIIYNHFGDENTKIDREIASSIFNNLLSNAIKYSSKNSFIEFSTHLNNKILTVVCKDKGIGIPQEEQNNLFKRYFRAKNTTNIQGTGLGLSIIKEQLDKIGGQIKVKSKVDKGTVFTVIIPIE